MNIETHGEKDRLKIYQLLRESYCVFRTDITTHSLTPKCMHPCVGCHQVCDIEREIHSIFTRVCRLMSQDELALPLRNSETLCASVVPLITHPRCALLTQTGIHSTSRTIGEGSPWARARWISLSLSKMLWLHASNKLHRNNYLHEIKQRSFSWKYILFLES